MDPQWDQNPNPDDERKHRYMDAREINNQQNQRERRIAAEQEKTQWLLPSVKKDQTTASF